MSVEIRLIGSPEIRVDGAAATLRGHKPWALLTRVLLADRPVGRQQLSAELFPDANDPLGSLRWSLAALRRALGSSSSFTGDPIEAALPDGTTVDVWTLADGSTDGIAVEGSLLEGVDPQSGPEFECWLLVERERVAGLIDAHLRRATIRATACGDHDLAIELARIAVRRRPLDEGSHVLLVSALSGAGCHDAAERQVAAAEAAFERELGVTPSPALRSAARRTVADAPAGISTDAIARSLVDSGLAALAAGAVDAGLDCLRRAAAEAERARDRHLHTTALFELGSALVHAVRGFDDEGAVLLGRVSDLADELGDAAIAAAAQRELGYVDALAGRRPTASEYLERAAVLAGDDAELRSGIHAITGFNLVDWGRLGEGLEHYERAIELSTAADKPRRLAWSLGLGAWGRLVADDLPGARAWLDRCLDVVAAERWLAFRPWPLALRGEVDLRDGQDPSEVLKAEERAFALSVQLGDPCWEGVAARGIALARAARDDHDGAMHWIRDGHRRCRRHTDSFVGMEAWILATEAELARAAGEDEHAEAAARELLSLAARAYMDDLVSAALAVLGRAVPSPSGDAPSP